MVVFQILLLTPISFPYKADTSFQRYEVRHTNRLFYDINGNLRQNDSGFALFPQDRRIRAIKKFVNLKDSLDVQMECENDAICGMPVYGTGKTDNTYFIPGPQAVIHSNVLTVSSTKKSILKNNRVKFDIQIEGPDRVFGAIKVNKRCRLMQWSMEPPVESIPITQSYMFSFFYGQSKQKFTLSLEFETSEAFEEQIFTLSLVAHHVHERDWFTQDFQDFLDTFPDWVYPRAWVSQYYRRDF